MSDINKTWIALVKTTLFLKGKTQKDMAEELGVSYQYVRGVMCGRYSSDNIVRKIESYCGIGE